MLVEKTSEVLMKSSIKLALKSIWKKNRGNQMFFLAILLLVLLPTILYNSGKSVLTQMESTYKGMFGQFTHIYYLGNPHENKEMVFQPSDLRELLPGFRYETYGVMHTTYKQEVTKTKELQVGYVDDIAKVLAEIKVISGYMPRKDNEVVLQERMAQLLGNKTIKDVVKIGEEEFVVSGIVKNFGHLWPKGDKQIEKNIVAPNAFVTKHAAERLFLKSREHTKIVLLVATGEETVDSAKPDDIDFFYNANNLKSNRGGFQIPSFFMMLFYMVSLVIVFMVLLLNKKNLEKRIKAYSLLGMMKDRILMIVRLELWIISFCGVISGLLVGGLLSSVVVKGFSYYIKQPVVLQFDWKTLIWLVAGITIGVAVLIILYTQGLVENLFREKRKKKRKSNLRIRRVKLLKFEYRQSLPTLALFVFLISTVFVMLSYTIYYVHTLRFSDIRDDANGAIIQDYDYQLVVDTSYLAGEEDTIMYVDMAEKVGISKEMLEKMKNEPSIKKINAYQEYNSLFVRMNEKDVDRYLDVQDFKEDGVYERTQMPVIVDLEKIKERFKYEMDEVLVPLRIISYPHEIVNAINKKDVIGEINLEKIISGEEVILKAPSYIFDEIKIPNQQGGTFTSRVIRFSTEEGAIQCEVYRVGDEIKLSGFLSEKIYNGAIKEEQLSDFKRYDISTKVGAIIRDNDVAKLTARNNVPLPFIILTVEEGLASLGLDATYSVASIYAEDEEKTGAVIYEYFEQEKHMILEDWAAEMREYKTYQFFQYSFILMFLIVLIGTVFVIFTSQLLIKTKLSMDRYVLFRINGVTYRKIIGIVMGQFVFVIMAGSAIGYLIARVLMRAITIKNGYSVFMTLKEAIESYMPPVYYTYIFGGLLLMVIALLPSIMFLRKHKDNVLYKG